VACFKGDQVVLFFVEFEPGNDVGIDDVGAMNPYKVAGQLAFQVLHGFFLDVPGLGRIQ
jgi:hypothetical protein